MSISTQFMRFGRITSVLAVAGFQAGCAQGPITSQASRIGTDDGTDSCRTQVVALDSTGNFFGEDILKGAATGALAGGLAGALIGHNYKDALIGAAVGGAAGAATGYWVALQQQNRDQASLYGQVTGDLSRENAQIDKTQFAFDRLMDCRFRQAQEINAQYRAMQIDRPTAEARMTIVRQHVQRDIGLAKQIDQQIVNRGQQFDVAADNIAPGTTAAIAVKAPPPRTASIKQPAALKLRPDPASPDIGQLAAKQPVTVTDSRDGYALVRTSTGELGYAPTSALQTPSQNARGVKAQPAATTTPASDSNDIRTLDGSNAARRDGFAQSVAVSEQAANTGFEVAG
jgi:hypothetical protein